VIPQRIGYLVLTLAEKHLIREAAPSGAILVGELPLSVSLRLTKIRNRLPRDMEDALRAHHAHGSFGCAKCLFRRGIEQSPRDVGGTMAEAGVGP